MIRTGIGIDSHKLAPGRRLFSAASRSRRTMSGSPDTPTPTCSPTP